MINNTPAPTPAPHAPAPTNSRTEVAPPTAPLRVVGYARVSTDLQREKETIRTQVELIEQFCQEKGHTLVETYCDDGVSGTTHLQDRPAGARLLQDARAGKFAAIIVYKADRLGRSALVNETIVDEMHGKLGIDFIGIAEQIDLSTPIGSAMFTFQSAIGKLERENTLQRSRDATLRLAREGAWLGGIVPYGYRISGKERSARLVVSDEQIAGLGMSEADVVRMIYEVSAELGATCIEIAKRLNDMGVPTSYTRDERTVLRGKRREKTAGLWTSGRVRNTLIEKTYKGIHVWGKRGSKCRVKGAAHVTIERAVPSIVDADTWQRAQNTLRNNSLSRPDIVKRAYLLRGLMKCGECARSFVGTVSEGRRVELSSDAELSGAEVRGDLVLKSYYICNGKNASQRRLKETGLTSAKCPSGYLRAVDAESAVWAQVLGFITAPDAVLCELGEKLAKRGGDAGAVEKELARIEAEVAERDAQRAMLFRLFRKGSISESDLERQLAETVEEEKALNLEAERLRGAVKLAGGAKESLESVKGFLEKLASMLDPEGAAQVSWETRRRVIESLVEKICVHSHLDPTDSRGRRRIHTLCIKYNFEDPRPSAGSANGLVLEKELVVGGEMQTLRRDSNAGLVRAVLESAPDLTLGALRAKLEKEHGLKLSPASLSRLRAQVGMAPDNLYTRASRARKNIWAA